MEQFDNQNISMGYNTVDKRFMLPGGTLSGDPGNQNILPNKAIIISSLWLKK
jgi:hypothetical protein